MTTGQDDIIWEHVNSRKNFLNLVYLVYIERFSSLDIDIIWLIQLAEHKTKECHQKAPVEVLAAKVGLKLLRGLVTLKPTVLHGE